LPDCRFSVSHWPVRSRFTYDLGQKWTQPPVLWSATDEVTAQGHHAETPHGSHAAIESAEAELIGGRASGKF